MKINAKWLEDRKAMGEVVGGGWFVFRRGKKTGRIGAGGQLPFEHGSGEAAYKEAERLARKNPGETFQVFGGGSLVYEGAWFVRDPNVENVEQGRMVS